MLHYQVVTSLQILQFSRHSSDCIDKLLFADLHRKFSISLVLASTVGMCLNTFTWMQAQDIKGEPVDNPKLALIEAICISYF